MPAISVLMPVRNGARHINASITSTLRSLPTDSELVVVDDASTDETPKLLDRIEDPRFRWIVQKTQQGVGASLANLIRVTDSKYVGRMDADDICLPTRLSRQKRILDAGMDISFTSVIRFTEGISSARPGLPLPITPDAMPIHFLMFNPLCHPTMLARRSVVEAVGGYRPVRAEDHDLWLRLLTANAKMARTGVPGIAYRAHAEQVSKKEGFAMAALADRTIRSTYIEFVYHLIGCEAPWLESLWPIPGDPSVPSAVQLEKLLAVVDELSEDVSPLQRRVIHRTRRHITTRLKHLKIEVTS